MRIDVQYQKHSDVDAPCIAKTEVMGEELLAIGKTWEEAKERLMAKVDAWVNTIAPPPESVEVASKIDEMDTEFLPFEEKNGRVIEAGKL